MDKLEYIPGDLVKFATNTYTIVNFEENFLHNKICYALISTNSTKTALVADRDILPIPLTPEILEKNGWKRNGGQYSFTFKPYAGDKVEYIGFFIEMFKNVHDMLKHRYFYITHENKVICGCFYVHEIQHLLFGLGLKHEMEV